MSDIDTGSVKQPQPPSWPLRKEDKRPRVKRDEDRPEPKHGPDDSDNSRLVDTFA